MHTKLQEFDWYNADSRVPGGGDHIASADKMLESAMSLRWSWAAGWRVQVCRLSLATPCQLPREEEAPRRRHRPLQAGDADLWHPANERLGRPAWGGCCSYCIGRRANFPVIWP